MTSPSIPPLRDALKGLADELIVYTHERAHKNHLTREHEGDVLQPFADYQPGGEHSEEELSRYIGQSTSLMQDPARRQDALKRTQLMVADRIVLNALGNMFRAAATPAPEERFRTYFETGLKGDAASQERFIDALKDAREKMIISIVQTMHPTIYHTEFARTQEAAMTQALETAVDLMKKQPVGERDPRAPEIEAKIHEARQAIDVLVDGMAAGKKPTPNKRVRVAQENRLDRANHEAMKQSFKQVVSEYNAALAAVADGMEQKHALSPEMAAKMRGYAIDSSRIEYRTWAFGADADGRSKATSMVLFEGIKSHEERDKDITHGLKFIGRKRDARENAKDHENSVSCLIQRAYRERPEFQEYCGKWAEGRRIRNSDRKEGYLDTRRALLQQLSSADKADFLHKLITHQDFHLVPPELEHDTIAFNEMFVKVYPAFLEEENLQRVAKGMKPLSRDTELESLSTIENSDPHGAPNLLLKLADEVDNQWVKVKDRKDRVHFHLDPDALTYESRPFSPISRMFQGLRTASVTGSDDVEGTVKDMSVRTLNNAERRKLLDVVKRLQVLNDAVGKYGNDVADRYQIANFSGAPDFYAALLLFKETGIIRVMDGKVAREIKDGKPLSPKLSIQPLLETEEDQKQSVAMFRKLLKDPLVKSYYEALGNKADIMLGYSDGAKSAGNFASEWSIYKCARELKKVFAEEGINLRVLHGRGRGDSRGGQFEEGQNQRMLAPELQKDMIYDVTMQSDLPMRAAVSPSFGKDMLAGVLLGTITARREAEEVERDKVLQDTRAAMEPFLDHIAEVSKQEYCRLVSDEPNVTHTMKLIKSVPDNALKASREPQRKIPGHKPTYEETRAITVEYAFNMVDAPLHYCGIGKALREFVASGQTVPDRDGKPASGLDALAALYEANPFFRDMMNKTAQGLSDYDPAVFRNYAKAAGVQPWAEECIRELNGTRALIQSIQHKQYGRDMLMQAQVKDVRKNEAPDGATPKRFVLHAASKGGLRRAEKMHSTRSYDENAVDPLRARELALDKEAHGLSLAMTSDTEGHVRSLDDTKKDREYNPFNPDTLLERGAAPESADIIRNLVFVMSESNRDRGLYAPAATRAAVDKMPYQQR